jgi:hypothetical protein
MTTAAAAVLSQPTSEAPPTEPSGQAGGAPLPTPATTGWWDSSVKDPEVKAFLANKNYAEPEMAFKAYRSLETMLGADKAGRTAILPKDDNDAEGRKAFYAKIGVPETPEGYKLPMPPGADPEFSKTASQWFHANGVPAKAAEGIATQWNSWLGEQVKAQETADKARSEQDVNNLKLEWAHEFDQKAEFARRAFRTIGKESGLEDADLAKLEGAIGAAKMLKMFSRIGQAGGEANMVGNDDSAATFGVTPSAAQKEIDQILEDRGAGKINNYQWDKQYGPRVMQLGEIVAKSLTAQQRS